MTIFDSAAVSVKPAKPFGKGLLRSLPSYRRDHTASDDAWLTQDNARRAAENAHYDAMSNASADLTRYERGVVYC